MTLFQTIKNGLLGRPAKRSCHRASGRRTPAAPRFHPELESLEQRLVPFFPGLIGMGSGLDRSPLAAVRFDPATGVLHAYANANWDLWYRRITVVETADQILVNAERIDLSDPVEEPTITSHEYAFARSLVSSIHFMGSIYDDYFSAFGVSVPVFADGRWGNDTVEGGRGNDALYGGDGNDLLLGGRGNDEIHGGLGADEIYGDRGNDVLYGETGGLWWIYDPATPPEGDHADRIHGGLDDDFIYGSLGGDDLWGNDGNDHLFGNSGSDVLYGGSGNDYLAGGAGVDHLYGDGGWDTLFGGEDGDVLWGGADPDDLYGENGDDWLLGEGGGDRLYGGSGRDRLWGMDGDDYLEGNDGNDDLYGGNGSDTVHGGSGGDNVYGGEGDDWIGYGSAAEGDRLYGEGGFDHFQRWDGTWMADPFA